jgi:O-antigen ligase
MLFCVIGSEAPLISLKAVISYAWFVTCFFFIGTEILKTADSVSKFYWLYCTSFAAVCVYSLINHASYYFDQSVSSEVMYPFVENHAIYGAMLAMVWFFVAVSLIRNAHLNQFYLSNIILVFLIVLFSLALLFSYTRAAWLSVVVGIGFNIVLYLRLSSKTLFILVLIGAGLFTALQTEILLNLGKNKTDSSTKLDKHLQSISNIKTDASNLERLNRWSCAWRMFKQKPLMGWGPGGFKAFYAPFQLPNEKTIISTNAGTVGGVHSEYFGPLVETGVIGLLLFLILIASTIHTGMKLVYTGSNKKIKSTALFLLLALLTYISHGFLNNYLDIDKTSCLFWGSIAGLVALDFADNYPEENQLATKTSSSES